MQSQLLRTEIIFLIKSKELVSNDGKKNKIKERNNKYLILTKKKKKLFSSIVQNIYFTNFWVIFIV